jgi:hypothetical protein
MSDPRWPARFSPDSCPVYARNEAVLPLPPELLWAALIDAHAWPRWYRNARAVTIEGHDRLAPAARFRWRTFGLRVRSTVTEFEPYRLLAWDGHALGSSGYHRWIMRAHPDGATQVITEEVQTGLAARIVAPLMRRGLSREHQHWITELGRRAAKHEDTTR